MLATLMAAMVSAEYNTLGIGYREYATYEGRDRLSMMGGAKLLARVDGGLNEQAGSNYLEYESNNPAGVPTLYSQLSRKYPSPSLFHPTSLRVDRWVFLPSDKHAILWANILIVIFFVADDEF